MKAQQSAKPGRARSAAAVWLLAAGLAACASLPAPVATHWLDQWGDRGEQVFARDYHACGRMVENHRARLPSCMRSRGWLLMD
ncbi:MAG: hypothetical protein QM772_00330 [Ottowia sp.]|uniref:hypothetical protein n=1 Tax=Ottowia sp. TaxID=1898956 RepID=UPI0039E557F5